MCLSEIDESCFVNSAVFLFRWPFGVIVATQEDSPFEGSRYSTRADQWLSRLLEPFTRRLNAARVGILDVNSAFGPRHHRVRVCVFFSFAYCRQTSLSSQGLLRERDSYLIVCV